jgi:hypothetical protein
VEDELRPDDDLHEVRDYALTEVHDPGGPFDKWFYVTRTSFQLRRVAYINRWITPNGPSTAGAGEPNWYTYNELQGVDVAGFLSNITTHEGFGFGEPSSGHMQMMVSAMHSDGAHNDPRRYLEKEIGSNEAYLALKLSNCLSAIDAAIFNYSKDNLAPFPLPPSLYYWSSVLWVDVSPKPLPPLDARTLKEPECVDQ